MMTALDTEALDLFHAGTTQVAYWDEFTDKQMDHWRAVALKAREIHAPLPTRHEIAEIVLHHWARDWKDPRYPTAVRCSAEGCDWQGRFAGEISDHVADIIAGGEARAVNLEHAARTLIANVHHTWETAANWEDMTLGQQQRWLDRAAMIIKAGQQA